MMGDPENLLARLQETARAQLSDFMSFEVTPDPEHPEIQNDGMPYQPQLRLMRAARHWNGERVTLRQVVEETVAQLPPMPDPT